MKLLIKKLRNVFSDSETNEDSASEESYINDIINSVEGSPFAISKSNVLYAGASELAGYHYFKTIVIGTFQLKTFKGAKLMITGPDLKLELKSDMVELASESAEGNRNTTQIDFEIDENDIAKISRANVESLELVTKKTKILFSVVEQVEENNDAEE